MSAPNNPNQPSHHQSQPARTREQKESVHIHETTPVDTRPMLLNTRAADYYEKATGEERIAAHFGESRFGPVKLILVLCVIIGAMVIGFSYMFKAGDTLNDGTVDPDRMHLQLQMMRNAAEIANEAQENNRLRMEQMQRVMQSGEQFGAYDADERFLPEDD